MGVSIGHCKRKIDLTYIEVKEIVRRMENSGATHIVFDYEVNCDTAEIERLSIDEFDNGLYLDTLYTLYND